MLVTVAEQCEQKIMDIREEEKQGIRHPLVAVLNCFVHKCLAAAFQITLSASHLKY